MSAAALVNPAQTSRRAWLILAVLLLFSIAAPLNQSKVPPILPILMEAWGLPVGQAGLLMSLFAVTGLVLALPAGFIFAGGLPLWQMVAAQRPDASSSRVGYRLTGLLAGGAIALGAAIGALSPSVDALPAGSSRVSALDSWRSWRRQSSPRGSRIAAASR